MMVENISWKKMGPQAIFDRMATHMIIQNRRAENELDLPAYKGRRGLWGPVGHLLREVYDPIMENRSISEVLGLVKSMGHKKIADKLSNDLSLQLIERIQKVHDDSGSDSWAHKLFKVAYHFNLSAACLPSAKRSRRPRLSI